MLAAWPPLARGARPAARRAWRVWLRSGLSGVGSGRIQDPLAAQRPASMRRAARWIVSPSAHSRRRDQPPRLAREAGRDQRLLEPRADHGLAVEALDRQPRQQPLAGGPRQLADRLGQRLALELDAGAGSPGRRARRTASARRRGAARRPRASGWGAGRPGRRRRASARARRRRRGSPDRWRRAPGNARRCAAASAAARPRRGARTGLPRGPRRSSRGGPCRASPGWTSRRRGSRSRRGRPRPAPSRG